MKKKEYQEKQSEIEIKRAHFISKENLSRESEWARRPRKDPKACPVSFRPLQEPQFLVVTSDHF